MGGSVRKIMLQLAAPASSNSTDSPTEGLFPELAPWVISPLQWSWAVPSPSHILELELFMILKS